MIALTPQMRILVAKEPVDFRKGIDGLCGICRKALLQEPLSGTVFVFTNRTRTAIKLLIYDGQGFWLCQKRLSQGRFAYFPSSSEPGDKATELLAHELQVLLAAGNPRATKAAPLWRPVVANVAA